MAEPKDHREYCGSFEEAIEHYNPFAMIDCMNCGNWHPDQYRCPCCGSDPSDDGVEA